MAETKTEIYRPSGSKKFARSKKKNWRKFLDTKDVDKRKELEHEELLAGGSVKAKPDADLFVIDTGKKNKKEGEQKKLSRSDYRKQKPMLHCEKSVLPNPHTKALGKSKISKNKKSNNTLDEKKLDKIIKGQKENNNSKNEINVKDVIIDLWKISSTKQSPEELDFDEFVEAKEQQRYNIKKPDTQIPKSKVFNPAVEFCHPGQSYNPSLEDHQSALLTAANTILKEEEMAEKLEKRLACNPRKLMNVPNDATTMAVMKSEDYENSDDSDSDDEREENDDDDGNDNNNNGGVGHDNENDASDNDDDNDIGGKRKEQKKKTKQQRSKMAAEKKLQQERKERKLLAQKESGVYRIKQLKKDLDDEDAEIENRATANALAKSQAEKAPQKFGKFQYKEEPLEVQLGDELSGSFRAMTPSNNLLRDRFRSFQKRNLIEARKKYKTSRRYQKKMYEKRSFKVRKDE